MVLRIKLVCISISLKLQSDSNLSVNRTLLREVENH
uniref:Uncharacterized protein n=1 Tax=Arundo donax TaxID=35708 RepID=A0A0A9A3W3_ARUDO